MERTRVDGTVSSVSGEKFRKWIPKVIADKWGDDVFIAKGDDKEMACPSQ